VIYFALFVTILQQGSAIYTVRMAVHATLLMYVMASWNGVIVHLPGAAELVRFTTLVRCHYPLLCLASYICVFWT